MVLLLLATAALLLFDGCASGKPTQPRHAVVDLGDTPRAEEPAAAEIEHTEAEWEAVTPEPEHPVQETVELPPPITLPEAAGSLIDWCAQAGLPLPNFPAPGRAEIRTAAGRLEVRAGQRFGYWNETMLGLGFAPVFEKGRLIVHSLDVLKNFQPLLAGPPLRFPRAHRVVVIDAGHGGQNPGAKAVYGGGWEKDLTLDWALRIERLMAQSGWQVVLTRRDDRDLSLFERAAIADAVDADLFISLHFNSIGKGPASAVQQGIETYCVTPTGMPSNLTREFADEQSRLFPNNAFDAENLVLGMHLHRALLESSRRKDRGLRRARFMTVLREQRRPAALLEGGFLTHPEEGRLIASGDFREALARGVANALNAL